MKPLKTVHLGTDPAGIARAVAFLRRGELVAFPTETVYGLGADARQGKAVAAVYAAKGRPSFNPLIVHVADIRAAQRYVNLPAAATPLVREFWPGSLTLVLPLRDGHGISPLVTAGLNTLAVRVPGLPAAQELLRRFDGPLAGPSANPSGRISPTTAQHVLDGLSGRIAAVLDDGPCRVGLESTIIGFADGAPTLLRDGGIPTEEIEAVLGHPLRQRTATDPLSAPGQLLSHYAPNAALRMNVEKPEADELFLGFGPSDGATLNLSPSGNLVEAAANLFGHLHQLDSHAQSIAVAPVPDTGLGRAINDRLRRAAAPRDNPA